MKMLKISCNQAKRIAKHEGASADLVNNMAKACYSGEFLLLSTGAKLCRLDHNRSYYIFGYHYDGKDVIPYEELLKN